MVKPPTQDHSVASASNTDLAQFLQNQNMRDLKEQSSTKQKR